MPLTIFTKLGAMFRWHPRELRALVSDALRWGCLAGLVGLGAGSACALFLRALEKVTQTRQAHPGLLWALPFAGVAIAWLYEKWGLTAQGGNNLVIDEIHQPGAGVSGSGVPTGMAPLILVTTLLTHLCGGSAGREGTAVQMGGSLAATVGRILRLDARETRPLLMCGIAAGFAGVFGTPLTGAVFAMEVLTLGRLSYGALFPCLIAAVTGDWTCSAWGVRHTHYAISPTAVATLAGQARFDWILGAKVAFAALVFALASVLFVEATHGVQFVFQKIKAPLLRPFFGGWCVIGLVYALGTRDYLGLGVVSPDPQAVTIVSSFSPGGAPDFSWFCKLVFTAVTLGSGFKGGEVTPLFFIGATLGNTLGRWLHAPVDLFAALGFVAIFAAATNTPLACTLMGIELFGSQYATYFLIACFLAYEFSGNSGIYGAQRIAAFKGSLEPLAADITLKSARAHHPGWNPLPSRKSGNSAQKRANPPQRPDPRE